MMRKKVCTTRYFLMVVFAGFVVLGTSVVTEAQNRVRTAYSSTSGIFTPVWIATEERLYQKYQLDVDTVYISGSPVAVSALIAGEIDIIYGGADPIADAILSGADLTLAGFISHTTPISLYVAPGIGQVEELRGKTVAVGRFASSATYMVKVCLAQHGMAARDVALIQSGGYPESVIALQSGRVQGAMLAAVYVSSPGLGL